MTFSKDEYWKNRKAGKRGQGDYPNILERSYSVDEWTAHTSKTSKEDRKRMTVHGR